MTSPCPKKEQCGSCGWSHIPYDKQLAQKLSDINGSFALKKLHLRCEEILPSPKTEHYRNRMDFVIDFEGKVGLRKKGKWWRVLDHHPCFLGDESIEHHFYSVYDWVKNAGLSFYDRKSHEGLLRYAVIRATSVGQTMLIIVTSKPVNEKEKKATLVALERLAAESKSSTVIWSVNSTITDISFGDELHIISGNGFIEENIEGFTYRITPNAFFQTNSSAAPLLLKTVLEYCGDLTGKTLLDLYCGSGFFSIALAKNTQKTIGVELNPDAIADAKTNATLNHVHVDYHDAKTEEYDWMSLNADVVILDPPRSGMHDRALSDVIKAQPGVIIYISCNYKNFAREMVQLQEYYEVEAMRAIDMFPHTPHVELVAKLVRKA